MKRCVFLWTLTATLLGATSALAGQSPLPSGEDAVVNVLLGQCLTDLTHSAPQLGSIDVHTVGKPARPSAVDPLLFPNALLVPTSNGEVYFISDGKDCLVSGRNLDALVTEAKVGRALKALYEPARQLADRSPPSRSPEDVRMIEYAIGDLGDPTTPLITVSYSPAHPRDISAHLSISRQVNVTTDSVAGWVPSDEQGESVVETTHRYLAARDSGQAVGAYAMLADGLREQLHAADFEAELVKFNLEAGAVSERHIVRVTWTKDPANAPLAGVYAAVDIVSRFKNIDRYCGYLVLYQAPTGGAFVVMREESSFIANATVDQIEKQKPAEDVEALWKKLSASCPNYPADSRG